MNNAFDADLYAIHKDHPGEHLDRHITIEQIMHTSEQKKEFNPYTDRPEESYQKLNLDRLAEKLKIAASAAERLGKFAQIIQKHEDKNGGLVF